MFARQGFHSCRVSDIADEAGVAYGLVYHYFKSKDEVMNELFTERWSLLLTAIEEVDGRDVPAREKLDAMLAREGRTDLAASCFAFLPTRARLDLDGWPETDIFAHT